MKRIVSEGQHSLCVQPTLLMGTYNEDGAPNFAPITWVSAGWDTDHYLLVISMFGSKRTKRNIAREGVLSANLVSCDMLALLDFFGAHSGIDGVKAGMEYEWDAGVKLHVPTLRKSRYVYELEVERMQSVSDCDTYFCGVHCVQHMEGLSGEGGPDLTQLDPVVYSGGYHSIAKRLGKIGDFYTKAEE